MRYRRSGVLWMSSGPGRAQRGDMVAVLMNDYDDAQAAG
jgi:N-alpha-acetyl-L-2,4-diaminobutyrate deacetylase